MGDSFGFGKDKKESSASVDIPPWLRPFIEQATGTAGSALSRLNQLTNRDDLVAGFTDDQVLGRNMARDAALGEGGLLGTAEDTLQNIAGGRGVESFLPPSAFGALNQFASGEGGTTGAPFQNTLNSFSQTGALPGVSRDALESTARGDFLFGGQGFDRAVEAAMNAARPQLASVFGSAGPGAWGGGLSQEAVGRSAVDAFARQFGQERSNQLGAANTLSGNALSASNVLGGFDQADSARQMSAAAQLGNFGNAEANRQMGASQMLPDLSMFRPDVLRNLGGEEQSLFQSQIDRPMQAIQMLLQNALGVPGSLSDMFGQSGTQRGRSFRLFGGD